MFFRPANVDRKNRKLILKKGLNDAIKRARSYVDAGADGIMIHSKNKSPAEIINFSKNLKNIS